MSRSPRVLIPLVATALTLSSCAAAVIPVVVGGVAARKRLKHDGAAVPVPASDRPGKIESASAVAPSQDSPAAAARPAMPSDPAAMKTGVIYAGDLPAAAGPAPRIADPTFVPQVKDPPPGAKPAPRTTWSDLLRYVAGRYAQPDSDSVLLTRGSGLTAPRWLPCAGSPKAVLVDLEAVAAPDGTVRAPAAETLGAIETIGFTIVYTTTRSGQPLSSAVAGLGKAGLHAPAIGATLLATRVGQEATTRATAGARYCVVALAADRPEDFPNRAPDSYDKRTWNAGWFFLTPPG